jgi:hypothetical protein
VSTAIATPEACVKRLVGGEPCPERPVVRYFVGPVCADHQIAGAQSYGSLLTGPTAAAGAPGWPQAVPDLPVDQRATGWPQSHPAPELRALPEPGRATAAAHVTGGPGETAGAALMAYRAGTIRARVLEHLAAVGPAGTTAVECWRWYCSEHGQVERYSVAPRLSELLGDGWAVKTGATRQTRGPNRPPEEVYALSPRGRRQLGLPR